MPDRPHFPVAQSASAQKNITPYLPTCPAYVSVRFVPVQNATAAPSAHAAGLSPFPRPHSASSHAPSARHSPWNAFVNHSADTSRSSANDGRSPPTSGNPANTPSCQRLASDDSLIRLNIDINPTLSSVLNSSAPSGTTTRNTSTATAANSASQTAPCQIVLPWSAFMSPDSTPPSPTPQPQIAPSQSRTFVQFKVKTSVFARPGVVGRAVLCPPRERGGGTKANGNLAMRLTGTRRRRDSPPYPENTRNNKLYAAPAAGR